MSHRDDFLQRMARNLQRIGLDGFAAVLLEGAKPLSLLAAQISYMADPLLQSLGVPMADLGRTLEDPAQVDELLDQLRQQERAE